MSMCIQCVNRPREPGCFFSLCCSLPAECYSVGGKNPSEIDSRSECTLTRWVPRRGPLDTFAVLIKQHSGTDGASESAASSKTPALTHMLGLCISFPHPCFAWRPYACNAKLSCLKAILFTVRFLSHAVLTSPRSITTCV